MGIFSCEDKPANATEAEVQADITKAKKFREKCLLYIQTLPPHPSNIKHIEVISSQFHRLTLTRYGSKMTESGTIIHYQKSTATIPTTQSHMSQAAYFLLTVMSLQGSVVIIFCVFTISYTVNRGPLYLTSKNWKLYVKPGYGTLLTSWRSRLEEKPAMYFSKVIHPYPHKIAKNLPAVKKIQPTVKTTGWK